MAERPSIVDAAQAYLSAGLCVLSAIRAEKRPAVGRWKQYQTRMPTPAELSAWMANSPDAVCILCGRASNHAEIIDFDAGGELFSAWWDRIPADLRERLVIERTPSGGWHVIYRCVCDDLRQPQARPAQGGREDRHPHRDPWRGRPVPLRPDAGLRHHPGRPVRSARPDRSRARRSAPGGVGSERIPTGCRPWCGGQFAQRPHVRL